MLLYDLLTFLGVKLFNSIYNYNYSLFLSALLTFKRRENQLNRLLLYL